MSITQRYTIRANRGRPRIWIEGKRLTSAGFHRGQLFTVEVKPTNRVMLRFRLAFAQEQAAGMRKVSGKGDRPIIDIVGSLLEQSGLKAGDAVSIDYSTNVIEVAA